VGATLAIFEAVDEPSGEPLVDSGTIDSTEEPIADRFDLAFSMHDEFRTIEAESKRVARPLTISAIGLLGMLLVWMNQENIKNLKNIGINTVSVSLVDGTGDGEVQPPPPPPPPPAGGDSVPKEVQHDPVVPDHNNVVEPTPVVKPEDTSGVKGGASGGQPGGVVGGVQGGVVGGVPGGVVGGTPGGVLGGTGKGGIIDTTFDEIRVKFQPPKPPYPPLARAARVEGIVTILLTVGPDGVPVKAEPKNGPEMLYKVSVDYAMQWRFEPYREGGVPRVARFLLILPYTLRKGL
jgi:protein TonB